MEFIAILICLSIERWSAFGKKIRLYGILERYISWMVRILPKSDFIYSLGVLVFIVPLILIILLLSLLFSHILFGILNFGFYILILLYCLGSFELNEHTRHPHVLLSTPKENAVMSLLMQANENIFVILFWFIIFGPIGAILYRVSILLEHDNIASSGWFSACRVSQILEWIPIRLEAFSYALVSHFVAVVTIWPKYVLSGFNENEKILAKCGLAALSHELENTDCSLSDLQVHVTGLIDRALIVWVVVIALVIVL